MERSGKSSYTVTGPRFSKHIPLIKFLEDIFNYTEHCFRIKNGYSLAGYPPPIAVVWKHIADTALNQTETEEYPGVTKSYKAKQQRKAKKSSALDYTVPLYRYPIQIKLNETSLEKLRTDSDIIREKLAIEDKTESSVSTAPEGIKPLPGIKRKKIPLRSFLKKLTNTEKEALVIISNGKNSLDLLARKHNTMPELLVDKINEVFMELSGDLLIDTVDEKPIIQAEYNTEVKKALEKGN
jgi:hypothetical protein